MQIQDPLTKAGAKLIPERIDKDPSKRGKGCALRQGIDLAVQYIKSHHQGVGHNLTMDDFVIAFMEPEKVDMVRCLPYLSTHITGQSDNADIVLPFRTELSWSTYPREQQVRGMGGEARMFLGGEES